MEVWKGNPRSSAKRSILKTLSWRLTASIDTFLIAWLVTGQPMMGGGIALGEILTKLIWYYLHERVWAHVNVE